MHLSECVQIINSEMIETISLSQSEGVLASYDGFLKCEFAQKCYQDISQNIKFTKHEYGRMTNMLICDKDSRDVYNGAIKRINFDENSKSLDMLLVILESNEFISVLSELVGEQLFAMRKPSIYKFNKGHYLCLHDDMSHQNHSYEVVINFTKDWCQTIGGESYGGYIKNRNLVETPIEMPFYLEEITIDEGKYNYESLPRFNSFTILKLSPDLCHGTKIVKETDKSRMVITAIYGTSRISPITTKWKGKV